MTSDSSDIPPVTSVVSVPSTASNPVLISINAAAQLPLKLSPTNYLSWRAQFNALLIGYDLMGYVDGSHSCPPQKVLEAHNPAYTFWRRQDQLLLHASLASVSEQVTPLLASATTSHEAWTKLSKLYANHSRSRVMSLKDRLHKPRDSKPVSEYLQTIKTISDELALIDAPVLADDLVLCILNGIGKEFKDIAGPLRTRDTDISFEELHDKLVDYETFLQQKAIPSASPVITAHSTHRQGYKGFCQLCDQQGHTAKRCPRARLLSSQDPIANCTTTNRSSPQNWLIDSAASHHVTADLGNLSIHSEYDGPDDIIIGDGSGLGGSTFFLGVEVISTPTGLFLSQHKYIRDLLNRTNMAGAKEVSMPLPTSGSLTLHDGSSSTDATDYRSVIGALQYLAITRPDIAFAVNKLSQFMHKPSEIHWTAAKRLLRYLKGTIHHGLFLKRHATPFLHAYSDADWAGNHDDRTSTTAYIIYLGGNAISWSSRKQRSVSRSSTEAEYRAVGTTTAELLWLQPLLGELGVSITKSPVIYCDNVGATYVCANPVFHSRMKHIAIDFHFVRDLVSKGILTVSHVATADQLADALTKPLSRQRLSLLRSKIGVSDGSTILRGRVKDKDQNPSP
ncbi:hypothetical protein RHSIM_Rhsim02G0160900 [Rhododendron simsii]|uniref:CCHC-type domain-containing protein n=1 Tax=Rhododendron simsii TaxID=118357 RepID=A0A834HNH3_RHOSS|nr:hypothetical protein RHSIM_Rhsim02G0160900 [Rhododendron simsii]